MEEAMRALLESIAAGENASSTQPLSSFILSNVGGTFSWAGESYTAAWLVKRAGLTASQHRNMVRDIDWLDPCLQVLCAPCKQSKSVILRKMGDFCTVWYSGGIVNVRPYLKNFIHFGKNFRGVFVPRTILRPRFATRCCRNHEAVFQENNARQCGRFRHIQGNQPQLLASHSKWRGKAVLIQIVNPARDNGKDVKEDSEMRAWSRTVVRIVMRFGRCIFSALAKGIRSERQSVQRDCLVTTAWLGAEMAAIGSGSLRYSACEILLDEVAAFLHPGTQLDERVLACLSVYNYTSGRGKMKLLNFSEGSRESLRRLSGVTWMAEELSNVIDYVLPTKSPDLLRKINASLLQIQIPYKLFYLSSAMRNVQRVSCVHTQTLEIVNVGNGSATALIFYKGHLYTGYSDGSIKVWDIKDKRPVLLWEVKMHKRSVTCFAVYEAADSLLSGSIDKTVWRNVQKKFECVEVIQVKEAVQKLGACNEKILIVAQSRGLKVCNASRSIQTVCKNKHVTSLAVFEEKIYLGCTDSSMQEIDINNGNQIEIRPPSTSWKIQKKPINSICVYKGWIYCAVIPGLEKAQTASDLRQYVKWK
ncbi:Alpha,alpha-trehalose-phosphate synthase [UDP-forming] 6 [Platanthera zijinensis]|uniref:Alpha,alpha-trehalose-phosphate synthase [UDP-forming] 6 n=1 Tax=Platanthera zijinensis TaxID=2320716 RepID=A0AAP0B5L6_9ASPA